MRVVAALGGNALLRRGEALSAENQRANAHAAARALAPLARDHELVVSHGNGPQVGLLALQAAAYAEVAAYPLDVLDAETEGMIGYVLQQELGNELPGERPVAALLTQVEVATDDPAFAEPTKPIGPLYDEADARRLAGERGWTFKPDGDRLRRVVASPRPRRILGGEPVCWLLERGCVVICAGGGGIPVTRGADGRATGVEAVIDKDLASALLAIDLRADVLAILTDVDAVQLDWGTPAQRPLRRASPAELRALDFAAGSMRPKVEAACWFAEATGGTAVIGSIDEAEAAVRGEAGTVVTAAAAPG